MVEPRRVSRMFLGKKEAMMTPKVKKAIFPMGGLGTRFLPVTKSIPKEMLPIVDRPLILYAVEEAKAAGIEEFIFITARGKGAIEDFFDHSQELSQILLDRNENAKQALLQDMLLRPGQVCHIRQQDPLGLGHAVWCARHLIGPTEPFAVVLADDLIKSSVSCLQQMVSAYAGGHMVAVQEVALQDVSSYGILEGMTGHGATIRATGIVEKPKPEHAPSTMAVIGRYILDGSIFSILEGQQKGHGGEIQLTDGLAKSLEKADPYPYLTGFKFQGERFDCGSLRGFLRATLSYAMDTEELREEIRSFGEAHFL